MSFKVGGTRTVHRLVYSTLTDLREPERVPQAAEPLNKDQQELDHMMRCTKVGCVRCG